MGFPCRLLHVYGKGLFHMGSSIFGVASDWHLGLNGRVPEFSENVDLLLVPGDVFDGLKSSQIDQFLALSEQVQVPIVMVLGNHDLYRSRRDKTLRVLRDAFRGTQVSLLNNESVVVNGVRVAGTDLWTDFELLGTGDAKAKAMRRAGEAMNDYRQITYKTGEDRFRRLRPSDTLEWHREACSFIEHELQTSLEPVVLMSHHAPLPASVPVEYEGNALSPAFASDLSWLFERVGRWPAACVHGHIHQAVFKETDRTVLFSNPYGYAYRQESTRFDPGARLVVDRRGNVEVFHS